VEDSWYFMYGAFDGYPVAKMRLDVIKGSWAWDTPRVRVCLLDDVHINCPVTEEDLALPELAPGTVICR
jgi:hypothetical protein